MRYDIHNLDPHRCTARVSPPPHYSSYQCENERKYGDFCGIHSPEKKAARKKARGPTLWERDMTAIQRRATRERALEGVLIAARQAIIDADTKTVEDRIDLLETAIEHYDKVTADES